MTRDSPCSTCKYRRQIPGDEHIQCANPARIQLDIGAGGPERMEKADRAVKVALELSPEATTVVRCVWPGSGVFPLAFDPATVFACANFTKGEPEKRQPTTEESSQPSSRRGMVPDGKEAPS
jgi:hypothetical protein